MYKLFIVEDEETIRNGLVHHICWEDWGFAICGNASNGKKALDQIRARDVDVVFTDVRMPVMDGLELARLIKEEVDPSIKVVILSGFGEFIYAQKSLEYGVFHYILKPIKLDQLADVFGKLKLEMDETQKERAEVAKLKSKVTESRRIYTDKLFNSLIKGQAAEIESLEIAFADVQVMPKGMYYSCAVFDVDNRGLLSSEEQSQLKSLLDHSVPGWIYQFEVEDMESFTYFLKDDKRRMVLLRNSSNCKLDEWLLVIQQVRSHFETSLLEKMGVSGITMSAGVGMIVEDAWSLKESYAQACEALAYRMHIGAGSVIIGNELPPLRKLKSLELQLIREKEKQLIGRLTANGENLESFVEEIFGILGRDGSIDSVHIKKIIEQVLNNVSRQVAESYPKWKGQFDDAGSIDQLTDMKGLLNYTKIWVCAISKQHHDGSHMEGRNLIKKIKDYVADQYHRSITLNEISEKYFLNASYFSWLFKQETGITFSAYLTALRMEAAKEMLREDTHKVYEIAEYVGYQDYRNFCKTFKKNVGVSPKDYKQRGRI